MRGLIFGESFSDWKLERQLAFNESVEQRDTWLFPRVKLRQLLSWVAGSFEERNVSCYRVTIATFKNKEMFHCVSFTDIALWTIIMVFSKISINSI